jgi:hypothetical protein
MVLNGYMVDEYEPGRFYTRESMIEYLDETLRRDLEGISFFEGMNPKFYQGISDFVEYLLGEGHLKSAPQFIEVKENVPYTDFEQDANWNPVRESFQKKISGKNLLALTSGRTGFSSSEPPAETQELTIMGYVTDK